MFKKNDRIKNIGTTMAVVSHSESTIKKICQREIWIKDGEICADGECEEIVNKYLLEQKK